MPALIKYIPTHLQNGMARAKFGDIFVQRLRLVDSYRYRIYNAANSNKIHLFDADLGIVLCGSNLGYSYQFMPQGETEHEMELFHIGHYCKKCLAKCETIEEK